MTLTQVLIILAGLAAGAVAAQVKFGRPAVGAVVGAGVGLLVALVGVSGPGDVIAVETYDDFEAKVLNSPRPVLVDFYSDRCGPCRKLAPTIETLAEEFRGRIDVVKIDVLEAPSIATEYGVRAIPRVMLFIDGKATHSWVGSRPTSHYRTVIRSVLTNR